MAEKFKDKVVVITGAGRGIGRALALGFAEGGASVVCAARTQSEIDATAAAIRAAGATASSQRCDVASPADLQRLYDVTRETYGRLDVVIANAGGNFARQTLEDSDIAAWEQTVRVNLLGVYYTARFAIPDLKARGGHIIVVGSGLGHRAGDNTHSAYSASKAGAWMLVRAMAKELSPYRICVNELIPGAVQTELFSSAPRPADSPLQAEWIKSPEDVLPLALFIASGPLTGPTGQSFSLMRRDSQ
ncbi:MAG: SDR family NAD(P)-dependent oxidoreductase [Chloroflexi bacterium]|nr:SDR family NAD(P)-dependent oxidoreductase [Chloroflexota bacterium]